MPKYLCLQRSLSNSDESGDDADERVVELLEYAPRELPQPPSDPWWKFW